jgi:hypothetical protein
MTLAGCYMATVNESETITEAQPIGLVRSRSGTSQAHAFGYRLAVAHHIERS